MNNTRPLLFAALFFLGFALYQNWQQDYGSQPSAGANSSQPGKKTTPASDSVPSMDEAPQANAGQQLVDKPEKAPQTNGEKAPEASRGRLVEINNGVLKLKIDTQGAGIKYAELLDYPAEKGADTNVVLMNDVKGDRYYAQSGLVSNAPAPDHRQVFETPQESVDATGKAVDIPFSWEKDGVKVTKTYHVEPNSYVISVKHTVKIP